VLNEHALAFIRVHKAELQPESGRSPYHVAVDETVIWLDGEKYWLYGAVGPETNGIIALRLYYYERNQDGVVFPPVSLALQPS
jgi:transposase-like protein